MEMIVAICQERCPSGFQLLLHRPGWIAPVRFVPALAEADAGDVPVAMRRTNVPAQAMTSRGTSDFYQSVDVDSHAGGLRGTLDEAQGILVQDDREYVWGGSLCRTSGEAAVTGPRLRRRGPRSEQARAKRRERNMQLSRACNASTDPEAEGLPSMPSISIMHINIRGFLCKSAELAAYIRILDVLPDILCINETFLDKSVEKVELEGFQIVGRRDRGGGKKCGGIIVFARIEIASHVTLLEESTRAERMWLLMHSNIGPYLLC